MIDIHNTWALQYSKNDNQFSILHLSIVLEVHLECFQKKVPHDYVLLGLYPSAEDAEKMRDVLKVQT